MSDLADAPQTGGAEAAPVSTNEPAAQVGADNQRSPTPTPSARDAFKKAMETVEAREALPSRETDRAALVLKEGAGAEERAEASAQAASEASERAKKGWETRRENAKTAEAPKPEQATQPVEAAKPVEQPKVETKYPAPPSRFKIAAEDWAKVPESVKAETDRALREMENGFGKYKESAERWAELQEYERLAREHYNAPLKDVMGHYAKLDEALAGDNWYGAFQQILKSTPFGQQGGDMRALAEQILGHEAPEPTQEVRGLKSTIANLERQLREIQSTVQTDLSQRAERERQATLSSVDRVIEEFKRQSPRFDELSDEIEFVLTSPKFQRSGDYAADLKKAYEMAERLNPAPVISKPAPDLPAPDRQAQTLKGQLSVSGSPGMGSNPAPAKKPVPNSARDAVRDAFARAGIPTS